jgi:hypothetical protein
MSAAIGAPFLAAVYDDKDRNWGLTADYDSVINAPDDHVIFVTTFEELRQELQNRNPTDDSRLCYEVVGFGYTARLTTTLTYLGKDVHELCNILLENEEANKYGVKIQSHELMDYLRLHALEHGLVSEHYGSWRFNPKGAHKRKVQAAYAERRRGIAMYEVSSVVQAMHRVLCLHLPLNHPPGGNWQDVVWGLKNRICFFNMLFGKNAHRKFSGFQKLLKRWRATESFGKDKLRVGYRLESFCTWLDKEAKVRCPKSLMKESDEWKPRNFVYPKF